MSAAKRKGGMVAGGVVVPETRITLDDLKRKAEQVKDIALDDAKRVSREVTSQDATRYVVAAVMTVAVVASVAYYLGSRRRPKG